MLIAGRDAARLGQKSRATEQGVSAWGLAWVPNTGKDHFGSPHPTNSIFNSQAKRRSFAWRWDPDPPLPAAVFLK